MSFTTLSDDEERELHRLSSVYWREALRCEQVKAFLAGSVLLGSALADLLKVAKAASWLPSGLTLGGDWDRRKVKVGDYAEVVRMVRNLVHPARYLEDQYGRRVTAKYLQRQFETVLFCRDWLAERNNKALREHMREEEYSDP